MRLVRSERLELSRLTALEPKSSVSTNSTTTAQQNAMRRLQLVRSGGSIAYGSGQSKLRISKKANNAQKNRKNAQLRRFCLFNGRIGWSRSKHILCKYLRKPQEQEPVARRRYASTCTAFQKPAHSGHAVYQMNPGRQTVLSLSRRCGQAFRAGTSPQP